MDGLLAILAIFTAFAAVLGGLVWLASRARRRGIGGSVMGVFDEIYRPNSHRARIEIQVQNERMLPVISPSDQ